MAYEAAGNSAKATGGTEAVTSNEHPDMHGNWADQPFYCDQCGKEVKEENAYGFPSPHPMSTDDELMFCSNECVWDYVEARYDGRNEHHE